MTCGVYMIRNKVNGKMYIGQSTEIEGYRWIKHRSRLRNNNHYNEHLQKDWNKYGEESFEFSILLECEENQLNTFEEYYIFELMTYDSRVGYNKNYGGSCGRHTEETKKKISESKKGKTLSEETKKKISEGHKGENNHNYGKSLSEETRNKISESLKGRTLSEETKKKIGEANKGEKHPFYGKQHTEETRKKISEANKGKKCGENNPMYGRTGEKNPRSKSVVQINPNTNEVVNIYSGVEEVERQTGFSSGNISACCNNKYIRLGNNIYKGFKWMFLEDYNKLKEL